MRLIPQAGIVRSHGLGVTYPVQAGGGPPEFDPTTLVFSGYWKGNSYNSTTGVWSSVASAGTSGSSSNKNLTDNSGALNKPAAGATLNGNAAGVLWSRAGTTSLKSIAALSTLITDVHNWTFGCLANITDIDGDGDDSTAYLNENILGGSGGDWAISMRKTGSLFQAGTWPTADHHTTITTGAAHLYLARGQNGGDVVTRKDGGAWSAATTGSGIGSLADTLIAGKGQTASHWVNGQVVEMFLVDGVMPDGDITNYMSYLNSHFGLGLT